MSTIEPKSVVCGSCGQATVAPVASSVNPNRSPALREDALAGRFHRFPCPHCGALVTIDAPFVWIDFDRKQFFEVLRVGDAAEWWAHEAHIAEAFAAYMVGPHSSATARSLAAGFTVRALFGVDGLREKLACLDAGLDDVELAALSLVIAAEAPFPIEAPPRLVAASATTLRFEVPDTDLRLDVPLDWIERGRRHLDDHPGLRDALGAGPFVDARRILSPAPTTSR